MWPSSCEILLSPGAASAEELWDNGELHVRSMHVFNVDETRLLKGGCTGSIDDTITETIVFDEVRNGMVKQVELLRAQFCGVNKTGCVVPTIVWYHGRYHVLVLMRKYAAKMILLNAVEGRFRGVLSGARLHGMLNGPGELDKWSHEADTETSNTMIEVLAFIE